VAPGQVEAGGGEACAVGSDAGSGGHVLDVQAGAEPAAGAGEDDDPNLAVQVGVAQGRAQGFEHR
jgi:hypothetical protein